MSGYFDNGPVVRMLESVNWATRELNYLGCEVLSVRLDSFKAVLCVEPCADLIEEFEVNGYGGLDKGCIRILWKKQLDRGNQNND